MPAVPHSPPSATRTPSVSTVLQWVLVVGVVAVLAYVLHARMRGEAPVARREFDDLPTPVEVPPPHANLHDTTATTEPPSTDPFDFDVLFRTNADADPHTPPFYHKPTDVDRRYPPVWIPVDSSMARVLQAHRPGTDAPPDFADVFRGYQRLALHTLFLTFGRHHRIFFVHKGNWHRFVPALAACASGSLDGADTLGQVMRLDLLKSHLLALYGGYWFPPDALVVCPDIHAWLHEDVLDAARADPQRPADTPLLVVAGIREVQHDGATEWFKDDSVLFAEPRNPVMLALARQMLRVVRAAPSHADYDHRNWFTKALHVYASSRVHPRLAPTVVVLPAHVAGAVDDADAPVTAEHYFRQRPLDHLPHPRARWFVVDTPDRRITRYPRYEWFAYLTEEAIVQSTLWISLLYRRALAMDRGDAAQRGTFRRSMALDDSQHPLRPTWARSWRECLRVGEDGARQSL